MFRPYSILEIAGCFLGINFPYLKIRVTLKNLGVRRLAEQMCTVRDSITTFMFCE